jgi:hypothetical protein
MTLVWRPGYTTTFADPDVQAYLTAVEEADNASLEYPVAYAINSFVLGCKSDSIWTAIKASCILAGARTLTGALVPLVGTAPTNVGGLFVAGDYNRKTGLVGNASTKYLNSNRANNADPQNSNHNAVYLSTVPTIGIGLMNAGGSLSGANDLQPATARNRNASSVAYPATTTGGLVGINRAASTDYVNRVNRITTTVTQGSGSASTLNLFVFARNEAGTAGNYSNARIAFYSIGESLNLALLDARVTDLINAFAAAIP